MSDLGGMIRVEVDSFDMIENVRQFVSPVSDEAKTLVSLELTDLNQKTRADQGNMIDQYLLGKSALQAGNVQKAEFYFAKLASQGVLKAMYKLGLIYQEIYKDSTGAFCCFQKAAQGGYAKAQFQMGLLIKERTPSYAFVYFKCAAEQGHAMAQFYTALCFKHGRGVDQNKEMAAEYFKKCACEGFKEKSVFTKFCEVVESSHPTLLQFKEEKIYLWHAV